MSRRGLKAPSTGTVNCGPGYDRPWYCYSCNLGPPKGKSFQSYNCLDCSVPSNRSRSYNDTTIVSNKNTNRAPPPTRKGGMSSAPQGDRQKRVSSGFHGRPMTRKELDFPATMRSFSPTRPIDRGQEAAQRENPRSAERSLRSILKHEILHPPHRAHDDNRPHGPPVTKRHQARPHGHVQHQISQQPTFPSLPPPPFRQSRIPRCTLLNGDVRQPTTLLSRSKSSNDCCYRRSTLPMESQYPARQEVATSATMKKKSCTKLPSEKERSVSRERRNCPTPVPGGKSGGTRDWCDSKSVPVHGVASGRRGETSIPSYDGRNLARQARSENDVRRKSGSCRRSPRMDEVARSPDELQYEENSWCNIDIVPKNPSPRLAQSSAPAEAPPYVCSETSGPTRPYYLRVFDWLSSFADTQWTNLKMLKQNYYAPEARTRRTSPDRERLRSKSCLPTNRCQSHPPELNSSPSANSCRSQVNQSDFSSDFPSAWCSNQEEYASIHDEVFPEEFWGPVRRNPGDTNLASSRPPAESMERPATSHSRAAHGRPTGPKVSSSASEINGSRLDRMQESAADEITKMRGPKFVFPRKLLKTDTLLTKTLTKEFEEVASAPSSSHRTAQLRKLLMELPLENFYVIEWLVINNIINETNASKFGRLFHVRPHVLEVLTRHRDLLFPDAL